MADDPIRHRSNHPGPKRKAEKIRRARVRRKLGIGSRRSEFKDQPGTVLREHISDTVIIRGDDFPANKASAIREAEKRARRAKAMKKARRKKK